MLTMLLKLSSSQAVSHILTGLSPEVVLLARITDYSSHTYVGGGGPGGQMTGEDCCLWQDIKLPLALFAERVSHLWHPLYPMLAKAIAQGIS